MHKAYCMLWLWMWYNHWNWGLIYLWNWKLTTKVQLIWLTTKVSVGAWETLILGMPLARVERRRNLKNQFLIPRSKNEAGIFTKIGADLASIAMTAAHCCQGPSQIPKGNTRGDNYGPSRFRIRWIIRDSIEQNALYMQTTSCIIGESWSFTS